MSTFLFDSIVFGPVHSRRLGVSLGINLLPVNRKVCTFDCIYCECGWTARKEACVAPMPSRKEVYDALREKLISMKAAGKAPDVITYAGNGEPTMHPSFEEIVEDTVALRDEFFPKARISVLSNASNIHLESVRRGLMKVDMNILKLDSANPQTIKTLNNPNPSYDIEKIKLFMKMFNGRFIVQTMFVRGEYQGKSIDNTTPDEIAAWLDTINDLKPQSVMVYTIARDTPLGNKLTKVSSSELEEIASMVTALGIPVTVSA
ncbi:MAG TPA: radical SAM protein [Bacteroidales bacterium]|nr:radical SAM protein [Bacteroidales bacterium]